MSAIIKHKIMNIKKEKDADDYLESKKAKISKSSFSKNSFSIEQFKMPLAERKESPKYRKPVFTQSQSYKPVTKKFKKPLAEHKSASEVRSQNINKRSKFDDEFLKRQLSNDLFGQGKTTPIRNRFRSQLSKSEPKKKVVPESGSESGLESESDENESNSDEDTILSTRQSKYVTPQNKGQIAKWQNEKEDKRFSKTLRSESKFTPVASNRYPKNSYNKFKPLAEQRYGKKLEKKVILIYIG